MPATVVKSKLPRLPREFYQGLAAVFWTHTFENRTTGWLTDKFHLLFREALVHACARHHLACPAYVLMPDHWHIVWIGLSPEADQHLATAFLRKHISAHIAPAKLQDRAHDRVLNDKDRKRGAFESACHYVRENPVRAKLTDDWKQWPHAGATIAGYPHLDPRDEDFWERFWRIHNRLVSE